jgi:S-DNA-T family DNA segregation ATPase FtsK/SpoIIIE
MTTPERQPILPGWLKSKSELQDNAYKLVKRGVHSSSWHGIRVPMYAARLALMSPRGVGRAFMAAWRIVFDHESLDLRLHHRDRRESGEYMALVRQRNSVIKRRSIIAAVLGFVVLAVTAVAWLLLPHWAAWPFGAALVLVLGFVGKPIDKPITKPATHAPGAPGPLRAPHVMKALCALGIGNMRNESDINLLFDVARIRGGYQIDVELPPGVAASQVTERRDKLSAALRRELGCVWPATGPRHEGHLKLVVRDQPMNKAKQPPWPLLKTGTVDVFKPAPLATNQQDQWVDITLAYTSGAIGALPRVGKTYYLREIGLIAALDPRCRIYAVDLKGTGDLSPLALVADFYSSGDELEILEEQLTAFRNLRAEMRRRAKVIRELPRKECPDNKTTSVLADRKALGLEPVLVLIDECQAAFENEDRNVAKEYVSIVTDLVKRGPAMGIMVYLATQKPDAKSMPTAIADNLVVRIALKMGGQQSNDQILGTSSYQAGQRATLFSFEEKGLALLKSDGAECEVVRSVVDLDAPAAEQVAARARRARQAAGRLTGMAADEVMESEAVQVDFLADVRQCVTGPVAHLGDLATALATLRPALYGHLDTRVLAGMLRGAGVEVATVYDAAKGRDEASQKGVRAESLDVAATEVIGDATDNVLMLTRPQSADSLVSAPVSSRNGASPA